MTQNDLIKLSIDEKSLFNKNDIFYGKYHAFYKSLVLKKIEILDGL